jgi:hypothetical protein
MQSDYRSCESHDEHGRQQWPEPVEVIGDSAPNPKYKRCEPNRLQPQRGYHDTNRYADLTN